MVAIQRASRSAGPRLAAPGRCRGRSRPARRGRARCRRTRGCPWARRALVVGAAPLPGAARRIGIGRRGRLRPWPRAGTASPRRSATPTPRGRPPRSRWCAPVGVMGRPVSSATWSSATWASSSNLHPVGGVDVALGLTAARHALGEGPRQVDAGTARRRATHELEQVAEDLLQEVAARARAGECHSWDRRRGIAGPRSAPASGRSPVAISRPGSGCVSGRQPPGSRPASR